MICPLWVKIHSYRVQLVSSIVLLGLVTFLEPLVSLYNQERPIVAANRLSDCRFSSPWLSLHFHST